MQRFGPESACCWVYTFKEGVLSNFAHDLKLEATEFEIEVSPTLVRGQFAAGSLRVVSALANGLEAPQLLSPRDKRKIEQTIRETVLQATQFDRVHFQSERVALAPERCEIDGHLTLRGVTRRVALLAERRGQMLWATTLLHQPTFGIAPYSAMMGALRVQPNVRVELALPARAISDLAQRD